MYPKHTIPVSAKRCTKCGEVKPFSEYYPQRTRGGPFGLKAECKACARMRRRRDYATNPETYRERQNAYHAKTAKARLESVIAWGKLHPDRLYAHRVLNNARKYGRIPHARTQFCFICGTSADQGVRMEWHHVDYSKPLEVIPVCASCHKRWHHDSLE